MKPKPLILTGTHLADALKVKVELLKSTHKIFPKLAIVTLTQKQDTLIYINAKKRAAEKIGITCDVFSLSSDDSPDSLLSTLNSNSEIHGIVLQFPLPEAQRPRCFEISNLISSTKDVDGLNIFNIGSLYAGKGSIPRFIPCTAKACMHLLKSFFQDEKNFQGLHVVVLGRSNIAGRPISQLLLNSDATVTICHSKTSNLESILATADIVISAIGKGHFIQANWLKTGSVIIDVGINFCTSTGKLIGDVFYDDVIRDGRVAAISPVPGGVGPLTVAMLMENVVQAAATLK